MQCSSADSKEEMRWKAEGSIKMKKKFTSSNHPYKSRPRVRNFRQQEDCFITVRFLVLYNASDKHFGHGLTEQGLI
jgi:hypothetical protein